jgi:hypothetical protein
MGGCRVDRLGDLVPVPLKGIEGPGDVEKVVEGIGLEHAALNDRVAGARLVEPAPELGCDAVVQLPTAASC